MNSNERSSHPSREQIEALLQYLERNPSLAKGFPKFASARDAARKHWERLAIQLNSMGGSAKTWKQWTKYWADKKSAVKKKAVLRAAACKTGDVEQVVDNISEVEERIILLIGGESFAIGDKHGDKHLAVDPLSEPHKNEKLLLPSASPPLKLEEVASDTDTTVVSIETLPVFYSPPRTPPTMQEPDDRTTPSRQGVYPIRASTPLHQHFPNSPPPSELPPRPTSPRQPRRTLIPPSQRRSQLARNSTTERFLRLEEQRLQLERRNTDILEAVTSAIQSQIGHLAESSRAIASALNSIGEGLKMLAERR